MKIITVPHPTLRQKAEPIAKIDKKTIGWLKDMGQTLKNKKNPSGVGLSAPQVDYRKRAFATYLPTDLRDEKAPPILCYFINPVVIDHSNDITLGPDKDQPILEGCLSIPDLWGPVPRWPWIEIEYQTFDEQGEVITQRKRFENFAGRVIQHEYDHLEGVLFTDYSLRFDLPVYTGKKRSKDLVEIDKHILLGI